MAFLITPSGSFEEDTTAYAGVFHYSIYKVAQPMAVVPAAPQTVAATTGVNPVETSYSLYGHNIPLSVFGVGRIGGDIISGPWVDNGNASFIISFGVPADPYGSRDLREIAFNSEVVWTAAGGFSTEPFTFRFYEGTLTQAADPLETSHFGADAVAYRPQLLLAFENLPLANTKFRKLPYVAALIGDSTGDDVNLGEAFTRLARSPWVGWTSGQFEAVGITDGLVHGGLIIVEPAEFLATIQQFGRFYSNWDILQTDKLRIVDRGSNVSADIVLDRTRLMTNVAFSRAEPNSTPRELELTTIDPDADYTLVPSTAKRPHAPVNVTTSVKIDTAYLPAIMDASFRQAIATFTLYQEEQARKKISFTAMLYGLEAEPGDLTALTGLGDGFNDEVFKVTQTTHGVNYSVEIQAEAILKCGRDGTAELVDCPNHWVTPAAPTWTFSSVDFGAADTNRWIVVAINIRTLVPGVLVSGVTIGGVAATLGTTSPNVHALVSAVYYAPVPTGAGGAITVTTSGGDIHQINVGAFRVVSSVFLAYDSDSQESSPSRPSTVVDVLGGGVVISAAMTRFGVPFTWDGATEVCLHVDDAETTGQRSCAMYQSVGNEAGHVTSMVASSGADEFAIATLSLRI